MMNRIHIVFASDDHYAQHMGVAILSLLSTSSKPGQIFFHLLDAGMSAENKDHILGLATSFNARCEFIRPDKGLYQNFLLKRFGIAALFRISLDTILPSTLDKVIYLDSDLILFDDIKSLWNFPLAGKPLAAVENIGGGSHMARLALNEKNAYFNSGVLVINLDQWRKEKLAGVILDCMHQYLDRLKFPDQDGLNIVLQGRWKRLPLRWNHQPGIYKRKTKRKLAKRRQELEEAIRHPGIVHYSGPDKPWHFMMFHPLKESYRYYLRRTPWQNYSYSDKSFGNRLKKAFMFEKHLKCWRRKRLTPDSW